MYQITPEQLRSRDNYRLHLSKAYLRYVVWELSHGSDPEHYQAAARLTLGAIGGENNGDFRASLFAAAARLYNESEKRS
jgi:hypothetical protein